MRLLTPHRHLTLDTIFPDERLAAMMMLAALMRSRTEHARTWSKGMSNQECFLLYAVFSQHITAWRATTHGGFVSDTPEAPWRQAHMKKSVFLKVSDKGRWNPTLNLSEEGRVRHLLYLSGKFSIENQRLRSGQIKDSVFVSSIQASLSSKKTRRRTINLASNPEVGYLTQMRQAHYDGLGIISIRTQAKLLPRGLNPGLSRNTVRGN